MTSVLASSKEARAKSLRSLADIIAKLPSTPIDEAISLLDYCIQVSAISLVLEHDVTHIVECAITALSSTEFSVQSVGLRFTASLAQSLPRQYYAKHWYTLTQHVLRLLKQSEFGMQSYRSKAKLKPHKIQLMTEQHEQLLATCAALLNGAAPIVRLGGEDKARAVASAQSLLRLALREMPEGLPAIWACCATAPRELRVVMPQLNDLLRNQLFTHPDPSVRESAAALYAHLISVIPEKSRGENLCSRVIALCEDLEDISSILDSFTPHARHEDYGEGFDAKPALSPLHSQSLLEHDATDLIAQFSSACIAAYACLSVNLSGFGPAFLPLSRFIAVLCAVAAPRFIDSYATGRHGCKIDADSALSVSSEVAFFALLSLRGVLEVVPRETLFPLYTLYSKSLRMHLKSLMLQARTTPGLLVSIHSQTLIFELIAESINVFGSAFVDDVAYLLYRLIDKDVGTLMRGIHTRSCDSVLFMAGLSDASIDRNGKKRRRDDARIVAAAVQAGNGKDAPLEDLEGLFDDDCLYAVRTAVDTGMRAARACFDCKGILEEETSHHLQNIEKIILCCLEEGITSEDIVAAATAAAVGGGSSRMEAYLSDTLEPCMNAISNFSAASRVTAETRRTMLAARTMCEAAMFPRGPAVRPAAVTPVHRDMGETSIVPSSPEPPKSLSSSPPRPERTRIVDEDIVNMNRIPIRQNGSAPTESTVLLEAAVAKHKKKDTKPGRFVFNVRRSQHLEGLETESSGRASVRNSPDVRRESGSSDNDRTSEENGEAASERENDRGNIVMEAVEDHDAEDHRALSERDEGSTESDDGVKENRIHPSHAVCSERDSREEMDDAQFDLMPEEVERGDVEEKIETHGNGIVPESGTEADKDKINTASVLMADENHDVDDKKEIGAKETDVDDEEARAIIVEMNRDDVDYSETDDKQKHDPAGNSEAEDGVIESTKEMAIEAEDEEARVAVSEDTEAVGHMVRHGEQMNEEVEHDEATANANESLESKVVSAEAGETEGSDLGGATVEVGEAEDGKVSSDDVKLDEADVDMVEGDNTKLGDIEANNVDDVDVKDDKAEGEAYEDTGVEFNNTQDENVEEDNVEVGEVEVLKAEDDNVQVGETESDKVNNGHTKLGETKCHAVNNDNTIIGEIEVDNVKDGDGNARESKSEGIRDSDVENREAEGEHIESGSAKIDNTVAGKVDISNAEGDKSNIVPVKSGDDKMEEAENDWNEGSDMKVGDTEIDKFRDGDILIDDPEGEKVDSGDVNFVEEEGDKADDNYVHLGDTENDKVNEKTNESQTQGSGCKLESQLSDDIEGCLEEGEIAEEPHVVHRRNELFQSHENENITKRTDAANESPEDSSVFNPDKSDVDANVNVEGIESSQPSDGNKSQELNCQTEDYAAPSSQNDNAIRTTSEDFGNEGNQPGTGEKNKLEQTISAKNDNVPFSGEVSGEMQGNEAEDIDDNPIVDINGHGASDTHNDISVSHNENVSMEDIKPGDSVKETGEDINEVRRQTNVEREKDINHVPEFQTFEGERDQHTASLDEHEQKENPITATTRAISENCQLSTEQNTRDNEKNKQVSEEMNNVIQSEGGHADNHKDLENPTTIQLSVKDLGEKNNSLTPSNEQHNATVYSENVSTEKEIIESLCFDAPDEE